MKKFTLTLLLCALTMVWGGSAALAVEKKSSTSSAKSSKVAKKSQAQTKSSARSSAKTSSRSSSRQARSAVTETSKKTARRSSSGPAKKLVSRKAAPRKVAALSEEWDDGRLNLGSSSVLVLDQSSGHPLLEKNSDAVVPIASISKLMTIMVSLDAGLDPNEVIAISDQDVDYLKSTRSRLQVGSTMTRDTAMLLALMSSENRAANALGRHYPGGLPAFVAAMNRKAWSLGMTRTRFEEPTGLSVNNVSTAKDLARMVAAAYQYTKIREYSTMAEARVDLGTRVLDFHNTNALVKNSQWQIGLSKTGYISEAGRCLVMQARVADKPVVMVLLDSAGKMTRVGDANRIKRWMESASAGKSDRGA